nr:unnamed protein product [Callosobruchus chinensis]
METKQVSKFARTLVKFSQQKLKGEQLFLLFCF